MVRDTEKYEQAVAFRKRGFTYSEIAKICDVSKGTVSNWLKNETFSVKAAERNKKTAVEENKKRLRLINKARQAERVKQYLAAERSAKTEFKHYKNDPQFIAGLMMYLAAGDMKTDHTIRFSSSDVLMHRIFITFATEYLGVERSQIKCWLLLYANTSEEKCLKRWSKELKLPYAQFHKNQFIKTKKKPEKTLHFGVGNTIIGSTVLKKKLNCWIELVSKQLS